MEPPVDTPFSATCPQADDGAAVITMQNSAARNSLIVRNLNLLFTFFAAQAGAKVGYSIA